MPTLSPISLTDRESTPATHTFVPQSRTNDVSTFVERDGVPLGDNKLTVSLKKTQSGRYNVAIKMVLPQTVTETVNGVASESVARVAYADMKLSFDASSTAQERDNAIGMICSSLDSGQSEMIALARDLETFY